MDFSTMGQALAAPEGVTMPVRHPNGMALYAYKDGEAKKWSITTAPDAAAKGHQAFPVTMQVVSRDSRAFRRRAHQITDEMRRIKEVTAEKAEAEAMRLVMSAVTGWSHIVWNGEILDFTDANLRMFFDGYRDAMEQVDQFCADRANFLRSASSN
jgi:hypothetical protein